VTRLHAALHDAHDSAHQCHRKKRYRELTPKAAACCLGGPRVSKPTLLDLAGVGLGDLLVRGRRCVGGGFDRFDGEAEIAFLGPEEAERRSQNYARKFTGKTKILPSHHDAEALDLLEVKRFGVFLQFPAIGWVEAVPRDEDGSVFGLARDGLRRQVEVTFPRDGGLLAAAVWVAGEESVFQDESVPLLCVAVGVSRSFPKLPKLHELSSVETHYRPSRCPAECQHTRTSPTPCPH
jgi:hypothetical protein